MIRLASASFRTARSHDYAIGISYPETGITERTADRDFAARFEAFLRGHWYTFDARNSKPRIDCALIDRRRDASDVAASSTFRLRTLTGYKLWTGDARAAGIDAPMGAGPVD